MRSHYLLMLPAFLYGQAHAFTLPDSPIRPYECAHCEELSHAAISSAWQIDNVNGKKEVMHKQESRSYIIKTSLGALEKGVNLPVQGRAAVVRITPMKKSFKGNPPVFYIAKNGVKHSINEASSLMLQHEAVPDNEFTGQNLAVFQLKPELGSGNFILGIQSAAADPALPCVVQVFDQGSDKYMSIETNKAQYQYGDEMTATFLLHDDAYGYPIDEITASLISTDGETIPLTIERLQWNTYQAQTKLANEANPEGRNWYIESDITTTIGGEVVKRHVHTALSYTIPSAAIREIKSLSEKNLSFSASVEAATASRYVMQALFMATNSKGEKTTIANVHSAAWLEPGKSDIRFSLPAEIANNYKAPYYLASIKLVDYGQLKPVYEFDKPIDVKELR